MPGLSDRRARFQDAGAKEPPLCRVYADRLQKRRSLAVTGGSEQFLIVVCNNSKQQKGDGSKSGRFRRHVVGMPFLAEVWKCVRQTVLNINIAASTRPITLVDSCGLF